MLGLGSNITKACKLGKPIVKAGLVLKHGYTRGPVQPFSTGSASFVAISTDYITTGVGNSLTPLVTGFTASIWAKFNATDQDYIVLASSNGSHQRMYIGTQGGSFDFGIGNAAWNAGTNTATTDWTHLALTVTSGGVATFYINGVVDRADSSIGTFDTDGTFGPDFAVGIQGSTSDLYTDGYDCNVGMWSAALTQPQVKSIMHKDYASLSASEKTNLVSWWNLDSVIDSADTNDGDNTVYDNHHGGNNTLSANLVTGNNSVFSGTSSDWITYTPHDATTALSYDSSKLIVTTGSGADGSDSGAKLNAMPAVAGKTYYVEADVWLGTYPASDRFKIYLGGSEIEFTVSTTQTTFSGYLTTTNTGSLTIYQTDADESGTFFIDNVSVKLVNGNTGTLS